MKEEKVVRFAPSSTSFLSRFAEAEADRFGISSTFFLVARHTARRIFRQS